MVEHIRFAFMVRSRPNSELSSSWHKLPTLSIFGSCPSPKIQYTDIQCTVSLLPASPLDSVCPTLAFKGSRTIVFSWTTTLFARLCMGSSVKLTGIENCATFVHFVRQDQRFRLPIAASWPPNLLKITCASTRTVISAVSGLSQSMVQPSPQAKRLLPWPQ